MIIITVIEINIKTILTLPIFHFYSLILFLKWVFLNVYKYLIGYRYEIVSKKSM